MDSLVRIIGRNGAYLLVSAAFGILFFFSRISYAVLGDGSGLIHIFTRYLLGASFEAGSMYQREPGSTWLFFSLIEMLRGVLRIQDQRAVGFFVFTTWQVTSCISGSVFVFMLLRFAERFSQDAGSRLVAFVSILCCGGTLFFFGYVEFYVIHYVSVFAYLVAALRTLNKPRALWIPTVLLCLSMALHFMSICLIPSLVYLYVQRFWDRHGKTVTAFKHIVVVYGASIVVLIAYYFVSGEFKKNGYLIPFEQCNIYGSYTLLSGAHILDVLNEIILVSGVGLVLLLISATVMRRQVLWNRKEVIFLTLVTGYLFALLVSYNSGFWMRDWDIYAIFGLSCTLLGLYCLQSWIGRSERRQIRDYMQYMLVGNAVVGFLPWLLVNTWEGKSLQRYENLVVLNQTTVNTETYDYAYAYEVLRKYYLTKRNDPKQFEIIQRMVEVNYREGYDQLLTFIGRRGQPEYHKAFLAALDSLSADVERSKRSLVAKKDSSLLGDKERFLYDVYTRSLIIGVGSYGLDVERQGEMLISSLPRLPYGYEILGWHNLLLKKDPVSALGNFQQAYRIDTLCINTLIGLGKTYHALVTKDLQLVELRNHASTGLHFYERALALDPEPWVVINLDMGYLSMLLGDDVKARRCFERYLKTDHNSPDAQWVKSQLSELDKSGR
jgi:tetratricopeptide (TPR) repeat protein